MLEETITLPGAILYLLVWALAHSEDLSDLDRTCDFIDMAIKAHPSRAALCPTDRVGSRRHVARIRAAPARGPVPMRADRRARDGPAPARPRLQTPDRTPTRPLQD